MKLRIIEVSSVVILLAFICILLYSKEPADVAAEDIREGIKAELNLDESQEATMMRFKRAYGLNAEDFEAVIYYEPITNMDVAEVLVVKLRDESQRETMLAAVDHRLSVQKKNFDGYGTDQTEILGMAQSFAQGRYVCFFVGRNSQELLDLFKTIVEV